MTIGARILDFTEITDRITVREILALEGLDAPRNRVPCPIHGGKNPTSFSFTDSGFYCFSCGAKGGLIDLVEHLHGCTRVEALRILSGMAGVPFEESVGGSTLLHQPKKPTPLSPLRRNSHYRDAKNRLEWLKLWRSGLETVLRIIRRNIEADRLPLPEFYAKEQLCLYQLEEVDKLVVTMKYKTNRTKRGNLRDDQHSKNNP